MATDRGWMFQSWYTAGERCPHFRGWCVQASMELGPEDVSLLERCPHFRGWYVQASMELGPEDVSLLERCPHFRGWYVQASMELGPEDVSLLERCVVCTIHTSDRTKVFISNCFLIPFSSSQCWVWQNWHYNSH